MRRWAAGRAGGRPAADGPSSPGTRGQWSRTLAALATLAVATATAATTAPAHAAPVGPAPVAAGPSDDTSESARPVRIDVGRLEPRTVTPGAEITVTGTLTNTSKQSISQLAVRLQRGERLTSRAEVATAGTDPATSVTAAFREITGTLKPGQRLPFTYSVAAADLQITGAGVYPLLLNVNGAVGGDQRRVGQLSTFVVQQSTVPASPITVAWLWPLVERSHRDADGGFVDDGLAASIAPDGRLDRALTVIERLPSTAPAGGGKPLPVMPVTLAIDPALVEELTIMAAGPYAVGGRPNAGTGTQAAAAFLGRLRAVAAVHPVLALPYGDVDVDSLVGAGLGAVVARSLPATGTAAEPTQGDGAPPPTAAPTGSGSTGSGPARVTGVGAQILADVLNVKPRTDLVWAAGGSLRPGAAAALLKDGIDELVLEPGGLTAGRRAVGADGGAATARATVVTAAGPLGALVADPVLGDVVGAAERTPGGPRIAEQRYLAELAVQAEQVPAGAPQTVLVAPPREIVAGLDGAGAMLADTAGMPWLQPGTLSALASGPSVAAGKPTNPADTVRLDPAGLNQLVQSVAARDDLARAVVGDPDTALRGYDAATARASSVAWRDDVDGFRNATGQLAGTMDRLRGEVTLVAPADGSYSLASSDSPLVLTVRNDLPFPVTVLLHVGTRGNRGLDVGDIGAQVLAPLQRTTLQVPTNVRQSGGFAVEATLTTPGGAPLGERVTMQVKSTAYGWISLAITIGAGLLLGLLFLRRLVRFLLRRRSAPEGIPSAPEGASPLPPTRSPV